MEMRTAASPKDFKHYTTERLSEEFLVQNLSNRTTFIWCIAYRPYHSSSSNER